MAAKAKLAQPEGPISERAFLDAAVSVLTSPELADSIGAPITLSPFRARMLAETMLSEARRRQQPP